MTVSPTWKRENPVLKQAEILALEVLKKAEAKLDAAKTDLAKASDAVASHTGTDPAERANLELKRDEQLRALQNRPLA